MKYILPLLLLVFFACSGTDQDLGLMTKSVNFQMDTIPLENCDDHAAFNLSQTSYKDSCEIILHIGDIPNWLDEQKVMDIIHETAEQLSSIIKKPIIFASDVKNAYIEILFEFGDGRGGVLGEAEFPPFWEGNTSRKFLNIDLYDMVWMTDGSINYDFRTIFTHELFHSLGVKHSDYEEAVMWLQYIGPRSLTVDDVLALSEAYGVDTVEFDNETYIYLLNNDTPVSKNFLSREFHTKCRFPKGPGTWLNVKLVKAAQKIRDRYNSPVAINSSYRYPECNFLTPGASSKSRHMHWSALDLSILREEGRASFRRDISTKSKAFLELTSLGIKGYGSYKNHFHIDVRKNLSIWNENSLCNNCD